MHGGWPNMDTRMERWLPMRVRWLFQRWLLTGCAMLLSATAADAQSDAAFARVKHLQRGINLSLWYAQSQDYSAAREESYMTVDDFKLVRSLGFDSVRLSIDPAPLIVAGQASAVPGDAGQNYAGQSDAAQPTVLDPAAMARLDTTVQQLTQVGLAVVLDIHPQEDWMIKATSTAAGTIQFLSFWKSFATHFAGTDPEMLLLEVLNEPHIVNAPRWVNDQTRLVAVIRAAAPLHTIIATGADFGGISALIQMEPLSDKNVIYSFHDYEPMEFTHQGATWAGKNLIPLRGVPYPSNPENVAPLLPNLTDDAARRDLGTYGQDRWDVTQMQHRIELAVSWAHDQHVPLWCGEFGVDRDFSPPADRVRWITDMRKTLEADGIGWDMWDYRSQFGLVTKQDGVTTVDEGVVAALGLTPQPQQQP
jgi:endoglucanase